MSDDLLGRLRIELSRMETRLKAGKFDGLEQEYQDMWCMLNTRHFLECGMTFREWAECDEKPEVG